MPDYSPAAATTACDAITHRVVSTQVEHDHIVKSVDPASYKVQQLLALSGSLAQLKDSVEHLHGAIAGAIAVSHSVQDVLAESVESCNHASAVVEKQIRRLEPGYEIETLNVKIVAEFATYQTTNAKLFTLIAVLLQIPEPDAQTARLVAIRGRSVLDEAVTASSQVVSNSHDQLTTPSPSAHIPESLRPPDYSPATSTSAAEGKKASGSFFSSLSHSFKAAASTLMPKPDQLAIAMCQSAKAGNVAHMKGFLAQGVNINGQDEDGYSPLICATRADQMDAMLFLLSAGADKAAKDSHGGKRKSALFHAAECGHIAMAEALLDVIKLFLDRGAEANTVSISGRTIFIHALQAGSLEHLRLLQRHGGDVNARVITGQPALHTALAQNRLDIVDFLLSHGADANSCDITGTSMLHQAVHKKNFDLTRSLLASGANPDIASSIGKTVLHKPVDSATVDDNTEAKFARMVLEKGADPNQSDSWGERLLCHVVEKGNTALLRGFLDFLADPNLMFRREETLILCTITNGRFDHARLLLKAGADPNKPNVDGRTPLVEATGPRPQFRRMGKH
ncbi:hypothetical protein ACHAQA_010171 [Verticillium albo-atrum]